MNTTEKRTSALWRAVKLALPLIVLATCALVAWGILMSHPTAPKAHAPKRQARLVTIAPAEAAPPTLMLTAHGSVEAADSTALRPRVSGQIVSLKNKLAPGTRFQKGDVLARIDDTDYRLALDSAQNDLTDAKASLRIEQGQQAVAQRELSLVDTDVSADERDLALRGPQLQQARGAVDAAETQVKQAKLDLDRTEVKAPFDGIVTSRDASVGDVVSTSDTLANLAATDVYWVDVSLPVDQLRWLHAASARQAGSPAKIAYPEAWGKGVSVDAGVLRIQPGLETEGRMARVLLRVPHPLGAAASEPGLLLDAYVKARIQARIPDDSVLIDSAYLHENDTLWAMADDKTLDIRNVNVVYRDADQAVIAGGLAPGDAVVTSELTAPIQGMPLRTESAKSSAGDDGMQHADRDPNETPPDSGRQAAAGTADFDAPGGLSLRLSERVSGPRTAEAGHAHEPQS